MEKEKIKQLYDYYKYLPLFLYYRVTSKGWTPSEDIFDKRAQGFSYLYSRFVYHHKLVKDALPLLKPESDHSQYVGDFKPDKILTHKELRDATDYENLDFTKEDSE